MDMDVSYSGKGVSLSHSSPVPEPFPSGGKTNENLMHPQKPVTKQFLSSTKERSILGERNGADSSHSLIQKPPTHAENTNLTNSGFQYPKRSSLAVSGADDDDSSSKKYDPLRSNYCSPRPKYLRYRPNRHRELFLSLESGDYGVQRNISADDEGPTTGHARGPPLPPREVTSPSENEVNVDGGYVESEVDAIGRDEDETDDEDEEEKEGYLDDSQKSSSWFLKFLLFTAAVLLLPLFGSLLENSPSSPTEPVVYGFGEMDNVFRGVSLNGPASDYQNEVEVTSSGISWELDERVENLDGIELPVDEELMFTGTSNMPSGEGCSSDQENLGEETTESNAGEVQQGFDQPPISETIGNSEVHFVGEENLGKGTIESDAGEIEVGFDQPSISEPMGNSEVHSVGEMEEKGGFDPPMTGERLSVNEICASDVIQEFVQLEPAQALVESIRETFLETEMSDDAIDSDEDIVPGRIYDDSKDEDTLPGRMSNDFKDSADLAVNTHSKLLQIVLTPIAIAIVSVLSLIPAYAYFARQPRTSHEQSNAVLDPLPPKVNTERIEPDAKASALMDPVEEYDRYTTSNLFPPLEHSSGVEMEGTPGTKELPGVKIADASSFLDGSVKDSAQELSSHTKTLEVELLGEFVIGETSSSLRACGRKPRLLLETEVSSYSFVQASSGVSSKLHHPPLESPTSDSSYGKRFTSEEKQTPKKKERGKDGAAATKKAVITTTPLRRSSRIRNRGVVTSP